LTDRLVEPNLRRLMKKKILVADAISERGVEALQQGGDLQVDVRTGLKESELLEIVADYSAIVVRSQTRITAQILEAASRLEAVGRAGVGVDNVDVEAATRRGVIVMNTPGGNTISTAEHAFSLLMSLARKIPQADASVKAGKWERKKFEGVELYGKSLGILGMGRIGTEIARRAIAFGMRVLAYDPYLSSSKARTLQVELVEDLEELLPQADFLTMHMPLTSETKHMLDSRRLGLCRKGVRIVNCARGGLVDERALQEALASGQVAGAALDVFEQEPPASDHSLLSSVDAIFTPHLGASTTEAQESVGIEIAAAIRAALLEGEIRNAVNVPSIDAKTLALLGPTIDLCQRLGGFLAQIAPRRPCQLRVRFSGKVAEHELTPLTRSVLTGYLRRISGIDVNQVNAPSRAENLGLKVIESRHSDSGEFTEWIEVCAEGEEGNSSVRGTFFGCKPRIVMVNDRFVEASPVGALLMLENTDTPGIVGHIGTLLGQKKVNIASMSLSRNEAGGSALVLLNVDSAPSAEVLEILRTDPNILSARVIELPE